MAILDSSFEFTGPIGNMSAYRMRGSDKIIMRKKGGASKERINKAPEFENTRRCNAEFSGRSKATRYVMRSVFLLKPLADYNIAGHLNALLKPVQQGDTVGNWGTRSIALSRNPKVLEGFSLNRKAGFESVVRPPLAVTLARETLSAHVTIPELLPGINFFPSPYHAWYSFRLTLGVIPDIHYGAHGYQLSHPDYDHLHPVYIDTPWSTTSQRSPSTTLDLQFSHSLPDASFSLILGIGIRYGTPQGGHDIHQVKHAGHARVLSVV